MIAAPVITVFVRHSADCKYKGDEFFKRCNCRKHFRYMLNGEQVRRKAGTRSWGEAERKKRELEDQLAGRKPGSPDQDQTLTLAKCIEIFDANKEAQGVKPKVRAMYARELERLRQFSEKRLLFTPAQALTLENLVALRATWPAVYPSSYSRAVVQKHINAFLSFAVNAGWIPRKPKLSTIKIDEPETAPLTEGEYKKLLEHASGKIRTLIQLMRWSGLAIRDASTLKRTDLIEDGGVYKIFRERTKTGEPLYIPIPPDVSKEVLAVVNSSPVYIFWDKKKDTAGEDRHAARMGEAVAEVFKAAGIVCEGHMISHRLRATFAVDMLQRGVPLEHCSKLLGHRSVVTTEKHYAKWAKGRQKLLEQVVTAAWNAGNDAPKS